MINKFRKFFPIAEKLVYFNHAATGPMSSPAKKVVENCIDTYLNQAEFEIADYFLYLNKARMNFARLIGAQPEEITFTHNTSEGLYIALINLPLEPGDKILVMDEVFPAIRYVVNHNLPDFEKEYISMCGKDPIDAVKQHLDERVKVVIVEYVQFLTGEMIDLKRLSCFLKARGIYLIVDGIQGIGAVDFNVQEIELDFLSCGAAKWLFGPQGAGFLYINKKHFNKLKRLHTGWLGADWKDFEHFESFPELFEDARMFEQGTRNFIGIRAFSENVKILLEFGLQNVEKRVLNLKGDLRKIFRELKYEIVTPEHGLQSGIITVRPKKDPIYIFNLLEENRIIISLRDNCLRFSPHFYNTEDEVEKIFNVLKE